MVSGLNHDGGTHEVPAVRECFPNLPCRERWTRVKGALPCPSLGDSEMSGLEPHQLRGVRGTPRSGGVQAEDWPCPGLWRLEPTHQAGEVLGTRSPLAPFSLLGHLGWDSALSVRAGEARGILGQVCEQWTRIPPSRGEANLGCGDISSETDLHLESIHCPQPQALDLSVKISIDKF